VNNGKEGEGEGMKKVRLTELSQTVRAFLKQVLQTGGVEIEDESGQIRGTFVPYRDPTSEEEKLADASLERRWEKTGRAMREAGVTEEDIDRDLQEGD